MAAGGTALLTDSWLQSAPPFDDGSWDDQPVGRSVSVRRAELSCASVKAGTVVVEDARDVGDDADEGLVLLPVALGLLLVPHPTASKTAARRTTPRAGDVTPIRTPA
jgi:hypothetical protein